MEREVFETLYILSENPWFTKFYLKSDTDLDPKFHLLKTLNCILQTWLKLNLFQSDFDRNYANK